MLEQMISIHALRGEGDVLVGEFACQKFVISIHALRGEGDAVTRSHLATQQLFQSTPSVGRATITDLFCYRIIVISIHALRGEGDHRELDGQLRDKDISIHALRGEGDPKSNGH